MNEKKVNGLCDIDNSCLIIIDIQTKLSSAIPEKLITRLRKNTEILLEAANQLKVPVITTTQYPEGLGLVENFISSKLSDRSKNFNKTCFSCFGADQLREYLNQINKNQIILLGIEAHICVLQSALEFIAESYDVFIVTDAIASRKLSSYDTALIRLNQAGCSLLNTESVLFEWLRDSFHPEFKKLSKLIL